MAASPEKTASRAVIRYDYHGLSICLEQPCGAPAAFRAAYRGYASVFDLGTGAELSGNLPDPQKKLAGEWFRTDREADMRNWRRDAAGNWRPPPVRPAAYDLDRPLSKDNDFWEDMQILRAVPYENYDVELWFANGSHKVYNLKKTIEETPDIAALKKLDVFMNIIGVGSGLHWNGDVDLDAYEFFKYGKDV